MQKSNAVQIGGEGQAGAMDRGVGEWEWERGRNRWRLDEEVGGSVGVQVKETDTSKRALVSQAIPRGRGIFFVGDLP